jgi:murein DD-endopeptidase MepM/ murein hydrolase activator NlpD
VEIFVPGGELPLPDVILGRGGLAYLAAREAEAAGVVLEDETNLRDGPGTDYGQQVQLDRGRQVALRARHADWLKVEVAGAAGWVRADLLAISAGLVEALPETDDFPPPPPRWVWPAWGTLTSGFGARWGAFHNGIDIANGAWTPIRAARAGQVIEAGWCRGYGYCVKIRHGGGVETIYGHMVTRPSVATGDDVAAGQRIGSMGSTYDRAGGGYSTGVHLHFTVIVNGRAVNPLTFLP